MKTIAIVLAGLCLAQPSTAANIKQGNLELNGSMEFSGGTPGPYDSGSLHSHRFLVGGGGQYFVWDHISVGASFHFYNSGKRTSTFSFGPVASYYFMRQEKSAAYVSFTPVGLSKREGYSLRPYSAARVGWKYFITDSVTVGPALEYEKNWLDVRDRFGVLGLFSIHL